MNEIILDEMEVEIKIKMFRASKSFKKLASVANEIIEGKFGEFLKLMTQIILNFHIMKAF